MALSISTQCQNCVASLKSIISTCVSLHEHEDRKFQKKVVDELERFSLWMGNIGAHHQPKSPLSLESRLEEAEEVLNHVLQVLDELYEVTQEFLNIVSGECEGQTTTTIISELDETSGEDGQYEEEELLEEIKACITHLFRVSRLIRQAAPTDPFAKALSRDRYYFNDQFDIAHVGEKYPKLSSDKSKSVRKRLGQAITQRRSYLSYIQDHQNKLKDMLYQKEELQDDRQPIKPIATPIPQSEFASQPSTFITKATSLIPGRINSQMLNAKPSSSSESDTRTYTTILQFADNDVDSSAINKIPRLDELERHSKKEVECPFCFRVKKFRNERTWRRHVFSDLRAYVCTFPNCNTPLFRDANDWFRHEMQTHRTRYVCGLCGGKSFQRSERYLDHVRGSHPNTLEDVGEDSIILDIAKQPLLHISAEECPCCSDWTDRLRVRLDIADQEIHGSSEHVILVEPAVFKRHVASHLEQLALFAVPMGSSGDGVMKSDAAVEEDAVASLKRSDLSSLAFHSPTNTANFRESDISGNNRNMSVTTSLASTSTASSRKRPISPSASNPNITHRSEGGSLLGKDEQIPYPTFLESKRLDLLSKWNQLEFSQIERLRDDLTVQIAGGASQWARCSGEEWAPRNRYANVHPYKANKVDLKVPEGGNNYINASPITLVTTKSETNLRYIATQGPKYDTVSHFWRMVWHESVSPSVIVMLTKTHEAGREKCFPYYPQTISENDLHINEHDEFQDGFIHTIHLASIEEDMGAVTEIRELEMKPKNTALDPSTNGIEPRKIWHLNFNGWPDFGVPEGGDRNGLLELIRISRQKNANNMVNPRFVHCSAGIGRTGTFIALDYLLQELDEGSFDEIDGGSDPILNCVEKLRDQRAAMVQSRSQFDFLYDVLREQWRQRWILQNPEEAARVCVVGGSDENETRAPKRQKPDARSEIHGTFGEGEDQLQFGAGIRVGE